jgi:hypothetical protein
MINKIYGPNFSNMQPEERDAIWDKNFILAKSTSVSEYYDKIKDNKQITAVIKTINLSVE